MYCCYFLVHERMSKVSDCDQLKHCGDLLEQLKFLVDGSRGQRFFVNINVPVIFAVLLVCLMSGRMIKILTVLRLHQMKGHFFVVAIWIQIFFSCFINIHIGIIYLSTFTKVRLVVCSSQD